MSIKEAPMNINQLHRSQRSRELPRKALRTEWFRLVTVATAIGVLALAGAGPSYSQTEKMDGTMDAVIVDFCSPSPIDG